jgi:hypothetical protein
MSWDAKNARTQEGRQMKAFERIGYTVALTMVVLAGQGCVAYRTRVPELSKEFKSQKGGTLTARLTVNAEHWANGEIKHDARERCAKRHQNAAASVFRKSGLFKEVGPDVAAPDVEIVIETKEEERFSEGIATACGATLLIFPAWVTLVEETSVKVATPGGRTICQFSSESEAKVIMQILLIPTIPSVFFVQSWATSDIYRSVAVEMARDPSIQRLAKGR